MMRRRLSTRVRLELFLAAHGRCNACDRLLTPGTRWEIDHIVPLALGGADTDDNLQVLCSPCHSEKTTRRDVPAIAKTERIRARHLGALRAHRPMPGGRKSPWKRTVDGRVVQREATQGDR